MSSWFGSFHKIRIKIPLFLCVKLPKKIPSALCVCVCVREREREPLNELQKWITGTFRYETLELVIELVICKLNLL